MSLDKKATIWKQVDQAGINLSKSRDWDLFLKNQLEDLEENCNSLKIQI